MSDSVPRHADSYNIEISFVGLDRAHITHTHINSSRARVAVLAGWGLNARKSRDRTPTKAKRDVCKPRVEAPFPDQSANSVLAIATIIGHRMGPDPGQDPACKKRCTLSRRRALTKDSRARGACVQSVANQTRIDVHHSQIPVRSPGDRMRKCY